MDIQDVTVDIETSEAFECAICSKKYTSKGSLKRHLQSHTGEKPYSCECGKEFTHKYLLTRHEKTHDKGRQKYICENCGASYASKGALSDHKKFKHLNEGFLCSECDKRFKNEYHLKRHVGSHLQEKKVCKNCGGLFRQLKFHQEKCGKKKRQPTATCNECGKTFLELKYLKEHMKYKHGENSKVKCNKCGKPFRHRKTMNAHKKTCNVEIK